ncbi:MAG: hypothetical protein KAY32_09110 [Candidatus Eisenbacteria sp.]|nr:hypothetical protein [Candidatus Eisenbacteria bacterium]
MRRPRRYRRVLGVLFFLGVLAIVVPQCLLVPERGLVGEHVANQRPSVRITGGVVIDAIDPDSAADATARVHFYWFGSDNDGVIRWFEWAIDDTVSEDAWQRTERFDAQIPFQAHTRASEDDFSGWHTFFVRSVDDDYARSAADRRFFNAHTIAPETEIIQPRQTDPNVRWARTLKVTWSGEDADGSRADRLPSFFEYKRVRFLSTPDWTRPDKIREAFEALPNEFLVDSLNANDYPPGEAGYYAAALRSWVRVPGTVGDVWLKNLQSGQRYGFAVRAIDEAGAVEPDIDWDNWIIFIAKEKQILLTVSEPSFGAKLFSLHEYQTWEVSVAPEQFFRFQWSGDASNSGTDPGPSNYGFDIPEPEEEIDRALDGMGGWIGWGMRSKMDAAVSFPREDEGITHNFYMKMRDISGLKETETRAHVAMTVARLSFYKKFLIIDDIVGGLVPRRCNISDPRGAPTDQQSDEYILRIFESVNEFLPEGDEVGIYNFWGNNDARAELRHDDAFLDTLGLYQNLIWVTGASEETGLQSTARSGLLASYIGAGGNMLLTCYLGPMTALVEDFSVWDDEPRCPYEVLTPGAIWDPFSLLYQQLRLRGCIDIPRDDAAGDNHYIRYSMVGARAENQLYPDLALDWEEWGCTDRGLWQFEALWPDIQDPDEVPWYDQDNGLEILYRSMTFRETSRLDSLPIAYRTFATAEDSTQGIMPGRIVVFGFDPYYFQEHSVKGAMTLALQWVVTGSEF